MPGKYHKSAPTLSSDSLRKIIDTLNEYGVSKYVDLPQIAVMGDTSCGKSSLLSAISNIQFPSSEKLTTRCPTQLILSSNETFSGKAKIKRFENNETSGEITIENMDQIPTTISNLTQKLIDEGQTISDDCIIIEASGPDFPNLTLTDLPGLIRTVGNNEDTSMIPRVRALVDRYLKQTRTIILAVVPANVDVHNTEILQAAIEADPDGDRTLAIITKLDLVDKGAETSVISLLNNQVRTLQLGYYAVRLRGQQDLTNSMSISQAIRQEETFFATVHPWNTISKERLGIAKLKYRLIQLMEKRVLLYLPEVVDEVKSQLNAARLQLSKLGDNLKTLEEKRAYFRQVTARMEFLLKCAISGMYQDSFFNIQSNRLRASIREKDNQFNKDISELSTVKSKSQLSKGDPIEVFYKNCWVNGRFIKWDNEKMLITAKVEGYKDCYNFNPFHIRLPLTSIITEIKNSRGEELPIFTPYYVFCRIVMDNVIAWKKPSLQLLDSYKSLTESFLSTLSSTIETVYPKFANFMEQHLKTLLCGLHERTLDKLNELITLEQTPTTFNSVLSDRLQKERMQAMTDTLKQLSITRTTKTYSEAEVEQLLSKALKNGMKTMLEKEAFEIHCALVAYLSIAKQRFIDNVTSIFSNCILKELEKTSRERLESLDDTTLFFILCDDDDVAFRRKELEYKVESLQRGHHEIQKLNF